MKITDEQIRAEAERFYSDALRETGFELFDNERKLHLSLMVSFAKWALSQDSTIEKVKELRDEDE